jgi:phosphoribosylamine--glycine ligase
VVLAADGYPSSPRTGDPITGLDVASAVNSVTVFHAGTVRGDDGVLRTAGGRVLDVTASGVDLEVARTRAYEAAGLVDWEGVRFRHDIASAAARAQHGGGR